MKKQIIKIIAVMLSCMSVLSAKVFISQTKQSVSTIGPGESVKISFVLNEPATFYIYVKTSDLSQTVRDSGYQVLFGTWMAVPGSGSGPTAYWGWARGEYSFQWDGKDNAGTPVAPGTYKIIIQAQAPARTSFALLWQVLFSTGRIQTANFPVRENYRFQGVAINKRPESPYFGYVYVTMRSTWPTSTEPTGWNYTYSPGGEGAVFILTSTGGYVGSFELPPVGWDLDGPWRICVDPENDDVYVGDYNRSNFSGPNTSGGYIFWFSPTGQYKGYIYVTTATFTNTGFRVTSAGGIKTLYSTEMGSTLKIYKDSTAVFPFSPTRTLFASISPYSGPTSGADGHWDVAVAEDGSVYAITASTHPTETVVVKFNAAGTPLWSVTNQQLDQYLVNIGQFPGHSIDIDPSDGNLWINKNGRYAKISSADGTPIYPTSTTYYTPWTAGDMKCDPAGNLVGVTDRNTSAGYIKCITPPNPGSVWFTTFTVTIAGTAEVSASPDNTKITITNKPAGTKDTISGSAGAVPPNAIVKIYSDSSKSYTALLATATANNDGSFGPVEIGDFYGPASSLSSVWVTATESGKLESAAVEVTGLDTTPPSANVTDITVQYVSDTQVKLKWTAVSGVSYYRIYSSVISPLHSGNLPQSAVATVNTNEATVNVAKKQVTYFVVTTLDEYLNENKTNISPCVTAVTWDTSSGILTIKVNDPSYYNLGYYVQMNFETNDLKQSYVIEVTSFTTIDLSAADNALKSQLSLSDSVITLKPVYSIVFRDSNGNAVSSPVNPGASITVTFYYSTAFKNALGNQETNLTVYKYNAQQNKWVEVAGSPFVNTIQRYVRMNLSEFSVFTLAPKGGGAPQPQPTTGEIKAYPNPVTKSDTQMTIIVPQGGSVELYNANAELVVTLTDDDNDGVISWNLKNKDDKDVVSGVYIGIVKDADKKKQATVKIAVIK
jgi:hypothetical protein